MIISNTGDTFSIHFYSVKMSKNECAVSQKFILFHLRSQNQEKNLRPSFKPKKFHPFLVYGLLVVVKFT